MRTFQEKYGDLIMTNYESFTKELFELATIGPMVHRAHQEMGYQQETSTGTRSIVHTSPCRRTLERF